MSEFEDYVMPQIEARLQDEEQVEKVKEALKVTGVDWIVNERRKGEEA